MLTRTVKVLVGIFFACKNDRSLCREWSCRKKAIEFFGKFLDEIIGFLLGAEGIFAFCTAFFVANWLELVANLCKKSRKRWPCAP